MTPLHIAAEQMDASRSDSTAFGTAAVLLEHGADVNAQNRVGMTPLHIAAVADDAEMTFVLFEAKADLNQRNHNGATPLEEAVTNGADQTAERLRQYQRWTRFLETTNADADTQRSG